MIDWEKVAKVYHELTLLRGKVDVIMRMVHGLVDRYAGLARELRRFMERECGGQQVVGVEEGLEGPPEDYDEEDFEE